MTRRYLIGLVMAAALLAGCGSATATQQPAVPEQGQATPSNGSLPVGGDTDVPVPTQEVPQATVDIHCTETDPHPIAQSIAETYQATYEEVMTFFCTGVGFEDIVLAYQTADAAGIEVEDALTMWYDFGSWEAVWQELGME